MHYLIRLYILPIGNPECNSATWSSYDPSCCTAKNPCGIGEGDCDRNDQCLGYLVCGKDNCGSGFPSTADCCTGNLNPFLSMPLPLEFYYPLKRTFLCYVFSNEGFGPVHVFNGIKANFYISTGQGGCSKTGDAKGDADYFCRSFYGNNFASISHVRGKYAESGKMGWQMHKAQGCTSSGDDIKNTYCEDGDCKIWKTETDHQGMYNIICSII